MESCVARRVRDNHNFVHKYLQFTRLSTMATVLLSEICTSNKVDLVVLMLWCTTLHRISVDFQVSVCFLM